MNYSLTNRNTPYKLTNYVGQRAGSARQSTIKIETRYPEMGNRYLGLQGKSSLRTVRQTRVAYAKWDRKNEENS